MHHNDYNVHSLVKDDLLKIRITKEQKINLRSSARKKGLNMSEYVLYCILKVQSLELEKIFLE